MVCPWCSLTEALLSRACPCTAALSELRLQEWCRRHSLCLHLTHFTCLFLSLRLVGVCIPFSQIWLCHTGQAKHCFLDSSKAFAKRCVANTHFTSHADDDIKMSLAINTFVCQCKQATSGACSQWYFSH